MAAVNGIYDSHQGFTSAETQSQPNGYATSQYANSATSSTPQVMTNTNEQPSDPLAKDEVGWYFVEQYYTTLSRNPEKLFLFYNKRSQFVSGQETEKVSVCVGQRAVNDKIKELDFQDCKVRVTNVDSQASDSNIVIQVIGEISNKSQPHKKFVQTFVLATQTNGYFVLNDIFRYLVEEEEVLDEEEDGESELQQANTTAEVSATEPKAVPESAEPQALTSSSDARAIEKDAQAVDKHIEAKLLTPESAEQKPEPVENGTSAAVVDVPQQDAATKEPAAEVPAASLDQEKPTEPEPTPAISPLKQSAEPVAVPKPSGLKSWASLAAAANRVATPVQPRPAAPTATNSAAKPQTSAPAPAASASPAAPSVATEIPAKRDESPSSVQQDEWTAVGGGHARQQSSQVNAQQDGPQNRAYIKNVFESVDAKELKTQLEKFGEISYFDVARGKNCAFVDFKTTEGYKAAVAANPHTIGSERLYVEERRIRPAGAFGPNRGQMQGGRGGRGGPQNAGRGNFQNGPRGGPQGGQQQQSRGGRGGAASAAPRGGRGGSVAA